MTIAGTSNRPNRRGKRRFPQNLERRVFLRYDFKSGQSSIHGQTLFEVVKQFYTRQDVQWKFLVRV